MKEEETEKIDEDDGWDKMSKMEMRIDANAWEKKEEEEEVGIEIVTNVKCRV